MNFQYSLVIPFVVLLNLTVKSQVAPGGVTTNLQLWLKADAGVTLTGTKVTAWSDQSINLESYTSPTITESPTFQDGSVAINSTNYNPAIDFYEDGNPDYLSSTLNATNAQTWFFHYLPEVQTVANGASGYGINSGSSNKYVLRTHPNINTLYSGNVDDITTNVSGVISQRMEMADYSINNRSSIANYARTNLYTPIEPYTIGWSGDQVFANRQWQGDVNEVIIYSSPLTAIQTSKINSYLGIKYGVVLSNDNDGDGITFELGAVNEGDYYATNNSIIWDADLNSIYHNNIIGIGREDSEDLYQRQSHTYDDTTRIYLNTLAATNIANTGTFNDFSYIMMGDNQGAMNATPTANAEIPTGLAGCALYSRLEREWKVTKTSTTRDFSWDVTLNTLASPTAVNVADLRLLVDDDGDFSNGGATCYFNGDGTGVVISYSNPVITVTGISSTHISNNSTAYITIASINTLTPLPVELVQFDVKCKNEIPELTWVTNTEINNDYFTIERSLDAINFEPLATVNGNGNSSTTAYYSWKDANPIDGTTYYRLKQTDFNGAFEYHGIIPVTCEESGDISIYPNPFENSFTVQLTENTSYPATVEVIDYLGRKVHAQTVELQRVEITLDELPSGTYFVKVFNETTQVVERIVKMK